MEDAVSTEWAAPEPTMSMTLPGLRGRKWDEAGREVDEGPMVGGGWDGGARLFKSRDSEEGTDERVTRPKSTETSF